MTNRQCIEPSAFSHYLATNNLKAPDYVVHDPDCEVIAAKWHRPASRSAAQVVVAQHTLMYHIGGSTSVAKFVERRCVGTRSQHGSITFSPRDEPNEWMRGGVCEVMHVYIAPSRIQRYAEENCACAPAPEIDPLFAVHDPWLRSYFMMLQSEFETFSGDRSQPDALLLTQSMELLIRHLVCWHSNISRNGRRQALWPTAPSPLAPRHLTRVLAYMEANIGRDVTLADLAQLVGVSKDHFIRSLSASPKIISFAAFARLLSKRLMPTWSSVASTEPLTRSGILGCQLRGSRAMPASRAHRDLPTYSRSTMECRQARSEPGHTHRTALTDTLRSIARQHWRLPARVWHRGEWGYLIRAIATGYSSRVAGGQVLQTE